MVPPDICSRLLLIVCQRGAANEVVERLKDAGVPHFTLQHGALGAGETGRHEATPVWPGDNSIIFCCMHDEQVQPVLRNLRELHDSRPGHSLGLRVFSFPVEELL